MVRAVLFLLLVGCAPEPRLAVAGASVTSGIVEVRFSGPEGHYSRSCSGEAWLGRSDGSAFADELPRCGSEPYFLDGMYFENEWYLGCLGCDYVSCVALPETARFSTAERLRTGTRVRPDGGAPVVEVTTSFAPGPWLLHMTTSQDKRCEGDAGTFTFVIEDR